MQNKRLALFTIMNQPLSVDNLSQQFLKILQTNRSGEMISLIVRGTIPMKVVEQCLVLDAFNAALVSEFMST